MTPVILGATVALTAFAAVALATRRSPIFLPLSLTATWREATFYRLRDAEKFLDKLENTTPARRELRVEGNSRFVVRWLP